MSGNNSNRVLEDKVKHLECYVLQQNEMQEVLKSLLGAIVHERGKSFFRSLVAQLTHLLDVRYALVAELINHDTARTLAFWSGDAQAENIVYSLAGTPCENVIGKGFSIYPDHVRQRYPHSQLLIEMEVESYIGIPLMDPHGFP